MNFIVESGQDWGAVFTIGTAVSGAVIYTIYLYLEKKVLSKYVTKDNFDALAKLKVEEEKKAEIEMNSTLAMEYLSKEDAYTKFMSKEFCSKNHEGTNIMITNVTTTLKDLTTSVERIRTDLTTAISKITELILSNNKN